MTATRKPYRKGNIYFKILTSLKKQKKQLSPTTLNIHIPGTGGRYNDHYPTYQFLINLETAYQAKHHFSPATILLEGTGAEGKDYIAPAMNAADTLEKEKKPLSFFSLSKGSLNYSLDDLVQFHATATLLGVIGGAGKNTNNLRILGALKALDEDGCLPTQIFLSGHSRGAINCISMANQIYLAFSNRINLHLLLTDPVPGPGYESSWDTHVVPPNVITFTAFYAANEESPLFLAHDCSRLVFANRTTTISCYPVAGDHLSFFNYFSFALFNHMEDIACAINGIEVGTMVYSHNNSPLITGSGAREGSILYHLTSINDACSPNMIQALHHLRFHQNANWIPETTPFEDIYQSLDTKAQRESLLQGLFHQLTHHLPQLATTVAFEKIKEIQQNILSNALLNHMQSPQHDLHQINFILDHTHHTSLVSSLHKKTLDLIHKANDKAQYNKHACIWETTLTCIVKLYTNGLLHELQQFFSTLYPSPTTSIFSFGSSQPNDEDDIFYQTPPIKLFLQQCIENIKHAEPLSFSATDRLLIQQYPAIEAIFIRYQPILALDMSDISQKENRPALK